MWCLIAERTGQTLEEAMEKTTSSQFLMWQARFEEEANDFNPDHWYYAQISEAVFYVAHLVRNLFAKKPEPFELTLKDFLIKFEIPKELTPEEKQVLMLKFAEERKKAWLSGLGIDPVTGKPKEDPRRKRPLIPPKDKRRGTRKTDGQAGS